MDLVIHLCHVPSQTLQCGVQGVKNPFPQAENTKLGCTNYTKGIYQLHIKTQQNDNK